MQSFTPGPTGVPLALEHLQQCGKPGLQVSTVDYEIQEAVFENEFSTLKSFGKILANGFTNDPGACEADE